jgi:hypothetical protein
MHKQTNGMRVGSLLRPESVFRQLEVDNNTESMEGAEWSPDTEQ